jgi:hypothetical protein
MRGREKKRDPYLEQIEGDLDEVAKSLDLTPLQLRFLRGRWLDQLVWFERKAHSTQRRYYALRLVTIAGGVVVPAIVSLNVRENNAAAALAWASFAVSLVVALSAALESFFHYGERLRSFRRTSEALKAQGWQFFELGGPYAGSPTHAAAFPAFVAQVELLVQQDLEAFITAQAQARQVAETGRQDQAVPSAP